MDGVDGDDTAVVEDDAIGEAAVEDVAVEERALDDK